MRLGINIYLTHKLYGRWLVLDFAVKKGDDSREGEIQVTYVRTFSPVTFCSRLCCSPVVTNYCAKPVWPLPLGGPVLSSATTSPLGKLPVLLEIPGMPLSLLSGTLPSPRGSPKNLFLCSLILFLEQRIRNWKCS